MKSEYIALAGRIKRALLDLEGVVKRAEWLQSKAQTSGDDGFYDGVALNLHGFYSGIERILERLAETLDGNLPKGENWHQALLVQVSNEVTGIRPAVISQQTLKRLDEYRGFRHVVRNVYTFHFDEAKLEKLVIGASDAFAQVRVEILAFADFLDAQE